MIENALAVFTICSNNYVAMAKVLIDSAAQNHPKSKRFLVLADVPIDERDFYPSDCEVIPAKDLGVPHFEAFAFRYDVMEFNTAVKPFMFLHLLSLGFQKILYFDPDIEIYCPLRRVLEPLERGASFVLTPHLCQPSEGKEYPGDIGVMQAGVYNLGFLGVGAARETEQILRWWARRLEYQCINDQSQGIFVDQKFMDLVPGFAGHAYVARDTSLNVAYWNMHQRELVMERGGWRVDGHPLGFFHFSGFDPNDLDRLSKHTTRFRGSAIRSALGALMQHYADRLITNGHGRVPAGLYAYGKFRSGTNITASIRKIFREDHLYWPDNPFDTYEDYLNSPTAQRWAGPEGGCITNLMAAVRVREPWLAQRFDPTRPGDAREFIAWWIDHARPLVGDERFIENQAQKVGNRSKPLRQAPAKVAPGEPDIDVIGYFRLALGVGEAGRLALRSLRSAGLDARGVAIALNSPSSVVPYEDEALLVQSARAPVQLFGVNADQLGYVFDHLDGRLRRDAYRIVAPFWELMGLPDAWLGAFDRVDEVWAPTRFIQIMLMRKLRKPVIRMPLTLEFKPPPPTPRSRFNLPQDKFLFFFSFDYLSFIERKNPEAILKAFKVAFYGRRAASPAALVLKTINSEKVPEKARILHDLLDSDPDVFLVDQTLSRDDTLGLIRSCDAVVSLHRSEGLGLLLAEAMVLGKPVISTDFSATTELVTPATGYPVDFRLVPVQEGEYPYHEAQVWADADVDHAAWQMRRVVAGGSAVSDKVAAARQHIHNHYGQAAVAKLQLRRLRMIEAPL